MPRERDFMIVTNNPLVERCMGDNYQTRFLGEYHLRDILVYVRDLVYAGYELYTHPLSGSVKPNETPYKSILVSSDRHSFEPEQAELIANSISHCKKFAPRNQRLSQKVLQDFQLIDYTLLAGALDFDAEAGLSKIAHNKGKGGYTH